ncbi:MAG: class I SAM-dependent methyltransferase [Thermoleophilia bacterium]
MPLPSSAAPDPRAIAPQIAAQRRRWSRRAESWNIGAAANPGLASTVGAVVEVCRAAPGDRVLDLGCGSGQVSIPLARLGAEVVAVDISPAMIGFLSDNVAREGLRTVTGRVAALEHLELEPESFDLVVSNYALHHLADEDKRRLISSVAVWLRPGGRVVIGDLMLGRGGDARDRAIIREKLLVLARRGPGGWWRIAKNAWRFTARTAERPLSMGAWEAILEEEGFEDIVARPVVSEAAIVQGVRPSIAHG